MLYLCGVVSSVVAINIGIDNKYKKVFLKKKEK